MDIALSILGFVNSDEFKDVWGIAIPAIMLIVGFIKKKQWDRAKVIHAITVGVLAAAKDYDAVKVESGGVQTQATEAHEAAKTIIATASKVDQSTVTKLFGLNASIDTIIKDTHASLQQQGLVK